VVFYLSKLLFWGFLQCESNFVRSDKWRKIPWHRSFKAKGMWTPQHMGTHGSTALCTTWLSAFLCLSLLLRVLRVSGIFRLPLTQAIFPDNIDVNNDQQLESLHDFMSQLEGKLQSLRSVVKSAHGFESLNLHHVTTPYHLATRTIEPKFTFTAWQSRSPFPIKRKSINCCFVASWQFEKAVDYWEQQQQKLSSFVFTDRKDNT